MSSHGFTFRLLFFFLTVFFSANVLAGSSYNWKKEASKLTRKLAKEISKSYPVTCCTTGGSMSDKLNTVELRFTTSQRLNKDAARMLLIEIAETVFTEFNSSKKLQPYFRQIPLGAESVTIAIYSSDPKGNFYYHPFIDTAAVSKGKVRFRTRDPEEELNYLTTSFEPYEEALRKVEEQRTGPSSS